jgi:hypothetical protein
MRGNTGFVAKRIRTAADRKTEMTLFLYQCADSALAATTVGDLCQRYGVDQRTAEYELTIARQKRA